MDAHLAESTDHPSWSMVAGPPFVGFILNWGLLGILSVQVYIYHIFFPKDPRSFKCLVYGVFILDCIQTLLLTIDMFDNFVYRWGSSKSFSTIGTGWFSFIILEGVISAIVQCSFSWRLWILARSKILTGGIAMLALFQLSGSVVGGAQLHIASGTAIQKRSNVALTIWLAGSALVDVLIAVSMTLLLLKTKSTHESGRVQHRLSNVLVDRLIFFVVETGAITATVAIVSIVTFLAFPDTYLHECPAIILAKLYSNTLLAGFNNRAMMERAEADRPQEAIPVDTTVFDSSSRSSAPFASSGRMESGLATNGSSRRSMGSEISSIDVKLAI